MKAPASVADWPLGFVICTARAPALPAGVVARTCVAETNVTPVAATPLTSTVAPDAKLVPVSVMTVPPVDGPDVGLIDVRVGTTATGGVYDTSADSAPSSLAVL